MLTVFSYPQQYNASTYERISWFIKGGNILWLNPLGGGDLAFSFGRYMKQEFPNSMTTKTHSGWLDFALGAGLPGLFLVWTAICLGIRNQLNSIYKNSNDIFSYVSVWSLVGLWFFWWFGEVSYREFFEFGFFMIALFSSYDQHSNK
jgi:O-antigen ligase